MANKKTIQQVDARITVLTIRLARDAKELNDLRIKRNKMVAGKIKVPPPPGKKVCLGHDPNFCADEFGDLVPSFGAGACIE